MNGDTEPDGWTLTHEGRAYTVRTRRADGTWNRDITVTTADGDRTAVSTDLDLRTRVDCEDGHAVVVRFDLRSVRDGQAAHCHLVPADATGHRPEGRHGQNGVPFTPPPGTRAARREAWAAAHPRLYAARHVAVAVGQVLFGLLGVGVLIRYVLSRIPRPDWNLPSLDPPDLPLPDIPWPDWDPPDLALPGWVTAVLATTKYWVPVLVAVGVAVREVDRRRRRTAAPQESAAEQGEQARAGQRDHHDRDRKLPD